MTTRQTINILYIEDSPGDWKNILEGILDPITCSIDIINNKSTDELDKCDLHKYQIVICNLLNDESKSPIHNGLVLLNEIRDRGFNIPAIIFSGLDLASSKNPLDSYIRKNETYVSKGDYGGPYFPTRFRHEFIKAIINSRLGFSPQNVCEDVLIGLGLIYPYPTFLEDNKNEFSEIYQSVEDRKLRSVSRMWKKLWLMEEGLPYLPYIDNLTSEELSGNKWDLYRDHCAHSIWVYLLGLYLYNGNSIIRGAIQEKFPNEEEFLFVWKVAALFHDIGYTCDVGIDNEAEFLKPIIDQMASRIRYPIHHYLTARGFPFSEDDDNRLGLFCTYTRTSTINIDSFTKIPPKEENWIFSDIERLVIDIHLAQPDQDHPLRCYFDLGVNVPTDHHPRCRDHGILSAMILWYQFHNFSSFIRLLVGKKFPTYISRKAQKELYRIIDNNLVEKNHNLIAEAVVAIALHNINVKKYPENIAKDKYFLSPGDYHIDLFEYPLAFLLAIVDVLQCWDRSLRRNAKPDEKLSIPHNDIRIICEKDMILWSIKPDTFSGLQHIIPKEEIQKMTEYLTVGDKDLSSLIQESYFSPT